MTRRPPVVEVIDDQMAEILRAKTGLQKLHIADRMFRSAREMIATSVRSMHPDWSNEQVNQEAARRVAHGSI